MPCPLCSNQATHKYAQDKQRAYQHCEICGLVFVSKKYHLCQTDEKAEYDQHENHPHDSGYRRFLSRLASPLLARLRPGSRGLDFGSGPGPTLSLILEEAGHKLELYDKFYAPKTEPLARTYHFVTATEVVEHLADPGDALRTLWTLLEPGGTLALMTKLVIDKQRFCSWHYKNDPTHIAFFSKATFTWLADSLEAKLEFIGDDVIFLSKPSAPQTS